MTGQWFGAPRQLAMGPRARHMRDNNEQAVRLKPERISAKQALVAGMLSVTSVVLTIIGPFNTFGMASFGWRLLYWGGLVFSSVVLASFVQLSVARLLPRPVLLREALTITVFSLLFTPFVVLWTDVLLVDRLDQVPGLWTMFLYVMSICVCISAFRYGGPELLRGMMPEHDAPPPPRLVRRLPEGFSGEILRLSGDGHYVNVSTTEGQFDVRIRLSDAVDEMDTRAGLWVHRSHWVARAAIQRAETAKGRARLVLTNGDAVPVGAKYTDQLEAAGIL